MSAHDWLSQEELIRELKQAGIDLSERTLRYWVAREVLPTPLKKPYRGADGRIGYFPRTTLTLIPQILKLQQEGWKLSQIPAQLAALTEPSKTTRSTASLPQEEAQEWATRYLHDLLADTESRDRRRCFASLGAPTSELRQIRHYLVARLERWVGRSAAVRATSAFLLGLSQRDFQRLLARLRVPSSLRLAQTLLDSQFPSAEPIALPRDEELPQLKSVLAQQRERLQRWSTQPSSPVVLARTLACLDDLEAALLHTDSDEGRAVLKALAELQQIESHAEADLAFLNRNARE